MSLPTNDDDLEVDYTGGDVTTVATKDNNRVEQTAATGQYAIHQFKDFVGDVTAAQVEWEGQTNTEGSWSTVYLQVYNQNTTNWETLDSSNTHDADTDFTLNGNVPDTTNYKVGGIMSCRVYQLAV